MRFRYERAKNGREQHGVNIGIRYRSADIEDAISKKYIDSGVIIIYVYK